MWQLWTARSQYDFILWTHLKKEALDTVTSHPGAPCVQRPPGTGEGWPGAGSAGWALAGPTEHSRGCPLCSSSHCCSGELEKQGQGDQHQHRGARRAGRMDVTPVWKSGSEILSPHSLRVKCVVVTELQGEWDNHISPIAPRAVPHSLGFGFTGAC